MTPSQIRRAISNAQEHAADLGRSDVLRFVLLPGTVIDSRNAMIDDGMLQLVDMNGALLTIDAHAVILIAGGLAPAPDEAQIDVQQGTLDNGPEH